MDTPCPRCGEAWDLSEMRTTEPADYQQFVRGDGCPACDFGTVCPSCSGSGKERGNFYPPEKCGFCHDQTVAHVRYRRYPNGVTEPSSGWYHGYRPSLTVLSAQEVIEAGRIVTRTDVLGNGIVDVTARIKCPNLNGPEHALDLPCPRCNGTGKFVQQGDRTEQFMWGVAESTDEEPMGILTAFMAAEAQRQKDVHP